MAEFIFAALALLAGLLLGSFLNVCIYRLPRDLSVVRPSRSFCPSCEKTIAWYDNIPLVSFVLLGGKCRECKAQIPWRYPLVEFATGVAFAAWAYHAGPALITLKMCVFSALIIALIATDFEERILPDEFTLGGVLLGLILAAFVPIREQLAAFFTGAFFPGIGLDARWFSVADSAVGAAVSSGAIWSVGWLYEKIRNREGLGLGDVKMIAMVGAFLGLRPAFMTLMMGALMGSIIGLLYIRIAKKDASTYELPFGSFLGFAALAVAVLAAR